MAKDKQKTRDKSGKLEAEVRLHRSTLKAHQATIRMLDERISQLEGERNAKEFEAMKKPDG